MRIRITIPLALLAALAAPAFGQAEPAESARAAAGEAGPERVRQEFTRLRRDYADLLASALAKEELTKRLRPLAVRVPLREAEGQLAALRESLKAIGQAGGPGSEAARRLAEEAAGLEAEVRRLRASEGRGKDLPAGWDGRDPGVSVVRSWFKNYVGRETTHLARTLPPEELERRTERLRRVVDLARAEGELRLLEELRSPLGGGAVPQDGPAGAALAVTDRAEALRLEAREILKTLYDAEVEEVAAGSGEAVIEEGISYGKGGETELKLDLARPSGDGPFPAIIFIHGGGWSGGSRDAYQGQIREAAKRGYVAATISYRLMKFDEAKKETTTATDPFPAQIHDAKAAVRWLRANAGTYHVDPDRIGVTGASAGGHLALLVGLTGPDDGLEGEGGHPEQSSRVQAVVNVFGPTEMKRGYETSSVAWIVRLFTGGTPEEAGPTYEKASPVTYVDKGDPPVLTLQGDKDALVPVEQAKILDEKMKAAGADHTLRIFEGAGHGFGGEQARQADEATWAFFEKHLKPR